MRSAPSTTCTTTSPPSRRRLSLFTLPAEDWHGEPPVASFSTLCSMPRLSPPRTKPSHQGALPFSSTRALIPDPGHRELRLLASLRSRSLPQHPAPDGHSSPAPLPCVRLVSSRFWSSAAASRPGEDVV